MAQKLDLIIPGRQRDLGDGFTVRRILPYATHRMVGPFIFFDHMGPVNFKPGHGLDVRPHPHINLATVTYLFSGCILHRDSLGFEQRIEPGAINWMTAGSGITHSERSPDDDRANGATLEGIQCWVALPRESEEIDPSFVHHPAASIPDFEVSGARVRLLLGAEFGHTSPVKTHSDILYLEAKIPRGKTLILPAGPRELAAYVVSGDAKIAGDVVGSTAMGIAKHGQGFTIEATTDCHVMILGGEPLAGDRFIWWNFVSSSRERLLKAIHDWPENFAKIPGDDKEFIPLPNDPLPKGTPL